MEKPVVVKKEEKNKEAKLNKDKIEKNCKLQKLIKQLNKVKNNYIKNGEQAPNFNSKSIKEIGKVLDKITKNYEKVYK